MHENWVNVAELVRHAVKSCLVKRRYQATVDLARIGHRQTTIHYGLEYDWIQSLTDRPGWSAQRSAEPSKEADSPSESLAASPGNVC